MPTNDDKSRYLIPNTTQMPNVMLDEWMAELSGSEWKVICYIARHTYGFQKEADGISLSQMLNGIAKRDGTRLDKGVGLTKKPLLQALRQLQALGKIKADRRRSQERGNEPTVYRLILGVESLADEPGAEAPSSGESPPPLGENLPQGVGGEPPPSPRGRNSPTQNQSLQNQLEQHHGDDDAAAVLIAFGISKGVAQKLARGHPAEQIHEKIELVEFLQSTASPLVARNPQGFLVRMLEEGYLAHKPKGFKSKAERDQEAVAKTEQDRQRQVEEAALERARQARREAIKAFIAGQPAKPIAGTQLTTQTAWTQVLERLKGQLSPLNFEFLLGGSFLADCQDGEAVIASSSKLAIQQLETRFAPFVAKALMDVLGRPSPPRLFFEVAQFHPDQEVVPAPRKDRPRARQRAATAPLSRR
jgi:hypothetical protein